MANLRADNLTGTGGRNAIDGSLYFQGYVDGTTSDYLKIPDSDDLDMGTGDFTFECWTQAVEHTGNGDRAMGIFSSGAFTAGGLLIQNKNNGPLRVVIPLAAGGNFDESGSTNLWYGHWHHIAVVKTSNTIKAFINGVQEISATHSVGVDFAHGGYGTVGENCHVTYPGDYPYRGYISNLRLIKGTALYTANFTPPTEKLTAVDGTVLLCCQDSDDPLQEETGKTITAVGNLDYSLRDQNLITNGNFDTSATDGWTVASGSAALGTGQSGTFGDGNHLVLTSGTMTQAFTTVIGRTYFVNAQSNGADSSYISTSTSTGDAIITDIRSSPQTGSGVRGQKSFVATQTTYYVILVGGGGGGNFDTVSVYEAESPKAPKVLPPVGVDEGVTFGGDMKVNSQGYMYFPTGDTSQRGRGRGLVGGGNNPGQSNVIQYVEMRTSGNSVDFGDLTALTQDNPGATASATRGLWGGGQVFPALTNKIDHVTIATTGNAKDFGDLTVARRQTVATGNQTRGIWGGGITPTIKDEIDYVTIATTGNAADFGNLSVARSNAGAASSPTRGLFGGGEISPSVSDVIDYVTIATTGNATDFGNLTVGRKQADGVSDNTRAVFFAGQVSPTRYNIIEYVTIASTGNATDFGDLIQQTSNTQGISNSIRGFRCGGYDPAVSAVTNTIGFITIQTTGNELDFGDLYIIQTEGGGCSDSHGGLS